MDNPEFLSALRKVMARDAEQYVHRMRGECRAANPDVFEIVRCATRVDNADAIEILLKKAVERE